MTGEVANETTPGTRRVLNLSLLLTVGFALAHLLWTVLDLRGEGLNWPGTSFSLGVLYAAALTCALAARKRRASAPAWRWIALAVGVYALADTGYALVEARAGTVVTPSVLDAAYLAFYVLFMLGILALPHQPLRRAEAWRLTLDTGIVVGALGVALWYGALALMLGATEAGLASKLVNLMYPVLDLCALGLLLTVIRRDDRFPLEGGMLALGLAAFIAGNTVYLFMDANGDFTLGLPVDLLWTAGALLFAVAAWNSRRGTPASRPLTTVTQITTRLTRPLYAAAPYLGLAVCFALSLHSQDENTLAAHGTLWGTAAVTLLVAMRQIVALRDNTALTAQLAALNASLESRVAARTAEVEQGHAQLEAHARELAWQAHHDQLTGLPNRAGFLIALGEAVDRQTQPALPGEEPASLAVLFLDLDGFKTVNDTLGHTVGDQLLIRVAARLRGSLQPGEFTARLGGDEFMVLTPQPPESRAQQVLELFAAPFDLGDRPVRVSASVGVSVYPDSGRDAESLYMHADVAMYEAKRAGKGAARVFMPPADRAARLQAEVENQLPGALERGEFSLHYQPIYGLARQITALEALLRWDSPALGLLFPGHFLPAAHGTGLDGALDRWALNEACGQLSRWHAAGHSGLRVAVNLSPAQFAHADFVDTVDAALARHALSGAALDFEIDAALLAGQEAQAAAVMGQVRERGVRWALCGFGARDSALAPLLQLPVGVLKIDRSIIGALDGPAAVQTQARRGVQAITALAGALGLGVMAEGVETRAQWQAALALGCDHAQGFWLGHPQNALKTTALLAHSLEQPVPDAPSHVV
ncbi:hypothetical protein GCM10010840_25120 [Deinococcus aerolatus]|uniref:Diguanylate cyclase/phosphodiesterase n=1 Tax=Deinococcus aerolatus TaxID=522487 RepID=A0ABQ2GD78_9DEIO|nr:EAL domain-containing protein [Deinococcus aerolatus]GGL86155.1 hypothetical protein GCM10010840_25120 [Deinococcus aerolatus]